MNTTTPLYDEARRLQDEFFETFEAEGEAIADPAERLRYYQTIAAGMVDVERKWVEIRKRAEDGMLVQMLLAGAISPRRVPKRILAKLLESMTKL